MNLSRNLLAGLANSVWSALIGLAVVPFYLKYLGVEAYGLIGFYVTTQAVLGLLDMGMAPTINREVARCSASGNMHDAGRLLHTLAVVYWSVAGLIAIVIMALAPWISEHWLQYKELSEQSITHAVMLMGLVLACRWPIGLYQGALFGAQRLAISSVINMVMATLGSFGTLAVLALVAPTIEAFFIWQACVGITYVVVVRLVAWKIVGKTKQNKFDLPSLKNVWRFTAGMSGVAVTGILLMQLDKVLLSKFLSLEDFGKYALAGVVASGLYVILTPTFNVIYPRLTALVVTNEIEKLNAFYKLGTRFLLAALFPIAASAAVFSETILTIWTGNPELAKSTAPIVSLILIGTAFNGAMHFPYALQLAYGATKLPLLINCILVSIMIPITVLLALKLGAIGGAAAWAILNGIYLLVGTFLTHRKLLKGIGLNWLIADVGFPLVMSLLVVVGLGEQVKKQEFTNVGNLIFASVLSLLSFVLIMACSPKMKIVIKMIFSKTETPEFKTESQT